VPSPSPSPSGTACSRHADSIDLRPTAHFSLWAAGGGDRELGLPSETCVAVQECRKGKGEAAVWAIAANGWNGWNGRVPDRCPAPSRVSEAINLDVLSQLHRGRCCMAVVLKVRGTARK
jgi:hypothetical protein